MYTRARALASPRAISLQILAALTAIDTHIARYIASYMAMQVSHPGTNVLNYLNCVCTPCPIFVNVAILRSWLYGNNYRMHTHVTL